MNNYERQQRAISKQIRNEGLFWSILLIAAIILLCCTGCGGSSKDDENSNDLQMENCSGSAPDALGPCLIKQGK